MNGRELLNEWLEINQIEFQLIRSEEVQFCQYLFATESQFYDFWFIRLYRQLSKKIYYYLIKCGAQIYSSFQFLSHKKKTDVFSLIRNIPYF